MEITKGKKEELLKAVSEEEVRAILGKDADDDLCPIAGAEGRWQHRYQVNLKENTSFCAVCGHVKR
ncbi:MAG: hypothetical protein Q4G00_06030 [Clostridia bacterium]|nr:hypothetical protein [Clostridia bacterium]